jgi:hypothetical protein
VWNAPLIATWQHYFYTSFEGTSIDGSQANSYWPAGMKSWPADWSGLQVQGHNLARILCVSSAALLWLEGDVANILLVWCCQKELVRLVQYYSDEIRV